jgi:hypothetical protein
LLRSPKRLLILVQDPHPFYSLYIRGQLVLEEEYKMKSSNPKRDATLSDFDTPRMRWTKSDDRLASLPAIKARRTSADGSASHAKGSVVYRGKVHEDAASDSWCANLYEPLSTDLSKKTLDQLLDLTQKEELKGRFLKREHVIHLSVSQSVNKLFPKNGKPGSTNCIRAGSQSSPVVLQ